jgi:hypothetical protein
LPIQSVLHLRHYGLASIHLVSDSDIRPRIRREIQVNTRPEADKTKPLTPFKPVIRFYIAKYAPRNQTRDLHASHLPAIIEANPERVTFVFHRRLVERCVQKAAGVIDDIRYLTVNRKSVGMNVKHVHEYADLQ